MGLVEVVEGGYCVGCGACEAVGNSTIKLHRDSSGRAKPIMAAASVHDVKFASRICPFSDDAKNETQLQLVLRQCSYCQLFAGSSNRELIRTEDQPGGSAFRFIDLLRVLPASTG